MKTRSGFVSNSSSSSFIIAVKKGNECPHCHRKDPDFFDLVDNSYNTNPDNGTKIYVRGAKETIEWIKENLMKWYDNDNPYKWDLMFKKITDLESSGYEIGCVSIGYHDETANMEFYLQNRKELIINLWGTRE